MGKRFVKKAVAALKSWREKKQDVPKALQKPRLPNATRFLLTELSHQSSYIPQLAAVYNRLIRNPVFHQGTTTLSVTGNLITDQAIAQHTAHMERVRDIIRDLKLQAARLAKRRLYKEMVMTLDSIRMAERDFNDAKKENLKALLHNFYDKKPSSKKEGILNAKKRVSKELQQEPKKIDTLKAVLNNLEIQGAYLPQSKGAAQALSKKANYHKDGKTLFTSGDFKTDKAFQERAVQMEKLRHRINAVRNLAKKAVSIEEMEYYIELANGIEKQFSGLKWENFQLIMHFFHKR